MDGLNKVLDKLGIYDLNAVLFPGIIAWSVTVVFLQYCFSVDIQESMVVNNVVFFLSISYLVGLVLQEIGSIILKLVDLTCNLLLKRALITNKKSHRYLTEREKQGISACTGINIEEDASGCFEYCRNYLIVTREYLGMDKDRTLAAFSRSIAVFCVCMLMMLKLSVLDNAIKQHLFWIIVLLLSVFVWRCYRLSISWHINILKRFYYSQLCKNEKSSVSSSDKKEESFAPLNNQNDEGSPTPFTADANDSIY